MEREERRRRRKDERRSVAVFVFRPPFSQVGVYAMQIRSAYKNSPTKLGEIPAAEESFSPQSLVKEQADNTPGQTFGWGVQVDDDDGEFAFFSSFLRAMQKTWHSSVYGHSAFPQARPENWGSRSFSCMLPLTSTFLLCPFLQSEK